MRLDVGVEEEGGGGEFLVALSDGCVSYGYGISEFGRRGVFG